MRRKGAQLCPSGVTWFSEEPRQKWGRRLHCIHLMHVHDAPRRGTRRQRCTHFIFEVIICLAESKFHGVADVLCHRSALCRDSSLGRAEAEGVGRKQSSPPFDREQNPIYQMTSMTTYLTIQLLLAIVKGKAKQRLSQTQMTRSLNQQKHVPRDQTAPVQRHGQHHLHHHLWLKMLLPTNPCVKVSRNSISGTMNG